MATRAEAASLGTIWLGLKASLGVMHWLVIATTLLVALPEAASPTILQWMVAASGAPVWLLAIPAGVIGGACKGLFFGVAALLLAPRLGLTSFPSPARRTGGWAGWAVIVAVAAMLQYLAVAVATIFLIIPGLIVGCMLFASIPVAALEKVSSAGALSRSSALTQDYRFGIFGIQIVIGIPIVAASIMALVYIGSRAGVGFNESRALPTYTLIVSPIISAVGAILSASTATAYYVRRAIRTSVGAETVAQVFD